MYKSATVSQTLPLTAIMNNCSFFTEKGVLVFLALAVHLCASAFLKQEQPNELDGNTDEQWLRYVRASEVQVPAPSPKIDTAGS